MIDVAQQTTQPLNHVAMVNTLNQFSTFKANMVTILEPMVLRETFDVVVEDLFMISVNEISNCFYYMNYSNLEQQRRYFHPDNSQRYLSKDQEEIMFDQICEYLWESEYLSSRDDDLGPQAYDKVTRCIMTIASTTVAAATEVFASVCRAFYQSELGRWYHHNPNARMIRDLAIIGHRGCLDVKIDIRL